MGNEQITFTIDGTEVKANKGEMILQAAKRSGFNFDIPYYCYHPELSIVAQCRICQVEIAGRPKLITACSTPVEPGMQVLTGSPKVKEARGGVMEMFLLNHPLDCPICDKGGECKLQQYTVRYHLAGSSFAQDKVRRIKHKHMGQVVFDAERCIMCTRCTRFDDEVFGTAQIGVMNRGVKLLIDTFDGGDVKHNFSGNFADLCPVGAWTTVDYRFKARPWQLTETKSICTTCSNGCQAVYWHLDNELHRMTSGDSPTVNRRWICDKGRTGYHLFNDEENQIKTPLLKSAPGRFEEVTWEEALRETFEYLKGPETPAILTTNLLTNESLQAFQRLAEFCKTTVNGSFQSTILKNCEAIKSEGLDQRGPAIHTQAKRLIALNVDLWELTPIFAMLINRRMRNGEVTIESVNSIDAIKGGFGDTLLVIREETFRDPTLQSKIPALKEKGIKEILPLFTGFNPRGMLSFGVSPFGSEVQEKGLANTKTALFMSAAMSRDQGFSPSFVNQLKSLDRLILLDNVMTPISHHAQIILPITSIAMSFGSATAYDGQVQQVTRVLQPAHSQRSIEDILTDLTSVHFEKLGTAR